MITKTEKWVINPKKNNDNVTKQKYLEEIKSNKNPKKYNEILYMFDMSAPESLKYLESYMRSLDNKENKIDLQKLKKEIIIRNMYLIRKEFISEPYFVFNRYNLNIEDFMEILLKYSVLINDNYVVMIKRATLNFFKKYLKMDKCKLEFCASYKIDENTFDRFWYLLKDIDKQFFVSVEKTEEQRKSLYDKKNELIDIIEKYITETLNIETAFFSSDFKELDYYSINTDNIDICEMVRNREFKNPYAKSYFLKKILHKSFKKMETRKITLENIFIILGKLIVDNKEVTQEEIVNAYYILEENNVKINKSNIVECIKRTRNNLELFPYRDRFIKEIKDKKIKKGV